MWRYVVGTGAVAAMAGAGVLVFGGPDQAAALPSAPAQSAAGAAPLPDTAPAATDLTREQRRFGRYDKDRDGGVTRDEYLAQRRKAYAKLDADGDGRLSFDEWAVKATTKFAGADRDRSGTMSATEFATTAVKRKPAQRCPPPRTADEEG